MKPLLQLLLIVPLLTTGAIAQPPIRSQKVQFPNGTSSTALKGTLKGDLTVDYLVMANAGHTLSVTLKTSNKSNYFNVTPQGEDAAIFIGSTSGNEYKGILPKSGEYTIRVYLMRNAARRNESANYTLTIALTGQPHP